LSSNLVEVTLRTDETAKPPAFDVDDLWGVVVLGLKRLGKP